MPYTVGDVDKHKKGLSDKEKREWTAIANDVLERCLHKGFPQTGTSGRLPGQYPSDRYIFRIRDALGEQARVGDQCMALPAHEMPSLLVFTIRIEVGAILLYHKDLLPQLQTSV